MKNSYISFLIFSGVLILLIFYAPSELNGFAVKSGAFNLEVDIPSTYSTIERGSEIHFTTKVMNLRGENRIDISLKYEIVDKYERIIISKVETMAIETQASFVGSLKIPDDIDEGNYDLHVTLLANDVEEARSRASFRIMDEENEIIYYMYFLVILIISLGLIVFIVKRSKIILEKFRMRSKIHSMIKKRFSKKTQELVY
jgi:hypothetical protein